jgi:hypothetical protein
MNLGKLFEGYYLAYERGQFIMHDGTTLGKPTVHSTNANNSLTITVPDSTVAGIATVFSEAINDYGFCTPLFYSPTDTVTYSPVYICAADLFGTSNLTYLSSRGEPSNSPSTNTFLQFYQRHVSSSKDFFLNGKTPTAASYLPVIPVVSDYKDKIAHHGGLTAQEAQFIRSVSSLTDAEAKALAGILIRSFGSAGIGGGHLAVGSLHVALGDNQLLAQIVEDLLSSLSYHVSEHELTRAFWKYEGNQKDVQTVLNNYQFFISKITGSMTNAPSI